MRRRLSLGATTGEALLVVLLFAVAAWWGARYVTEWRASGRTQAFYQEYYEPAVMMACGRGFVVSEPPMTPALLDFVFQRTDRFDCSSLPPDLRVVADGFPQTAWFHLMLTVAAVWKVTGISWSGLVPLFGVLFGAVIVLAYALFRTAVPPWMAVPAALALTVSSLHLQNLPHLRDYAKAPFVLALILILVLMVARPMASRMILIAAGLYGAVLGVGYGFRTDLLANIPPFVIALLFFLPGGIRAHVKVRVAALVVAATTFMVCSWPAASFVVERGGCQWHVVLLGLDARFTQDLGVTPTYYQWTSAYSDEYIHTAVNSYAYRQTGAGPLEYCSADYDAASAAYLRDIVQRFPADTVTRAYASVLRVLDLPFYWWHTSGGDPDAPQRSALGTLLTYVAGTARLAVVAAVLLIGAQSLRLGLFVLCLVLYFGGYPSLQFANRHYFHLEFLGWWAMVFLGWQAIRFWWPGTRAGLPATAEDWRGLGVGAARFAAITGLALLLPLPVLRAYQHREVETLTRTLLDAPRVEVPMAPTVDGGGLTPLAGSLADLGGDQRQVAYLDVHLDLAACPNGVPLGVRYDPAYPSFDFSSAIGARPPGTIPARVLLPVYRYFEGFTLGGAPPSCVDRVERLQSVAGRPLLPVLTLSEGWRSLPFHQGLRPPVWWLRLRGAGSGSGPGG